MISVSGVNSVFLGATEANSFKSFLHQRNILLGSQYLSQRKTTTTISILSSLSKNNVGVFLHFGFILRRDRLLTEACFFLSFGLLCQGNTVSLCSQSNNISLWLGGKPITVIYWDTQPELTNNEGPKEKKISSAWQQFAHRTR